MNKSDNYRRNMHRKYSRDSRSPKSHIRRASPSASSSALRYESAKKVPYFSDEVRERDRLYRLYGSSSPKAIKSKSKIRELPMPCSRTYRLSRDEQSPSKRWKHKRHYRRSRSRSCSRTRSCEGRGTATCYRNQQHIYTCGRNTMLRPEMVTIPLSNHCHSRGATCAYSYPYQVCAAQRVSMAAESMQGQFQRLTPCHMAYVPYMANVAPTLTPLYKPQCCSPLMNAQLRNRMQMPGYLGLGSSNFRPL